jgi:hypothetical protein
MAASPGKCKNLAAEANLVSRPGQDAEAQELHEAVQKQTTGRGHSSVSRAVHMPEKHEFFSVG